MIVMTIVATNMPPQPPTLNPRFQPEKSPGDNRRPTPSAQSAKTPAWRSEFAFFEIVLAGYVIRNPAFMSLLSHFPTPPVISPVLTAQIHTMACLDLNSPGVAAKEYRPARSAQLRWLCLVADLVVANFDHGRQEGSRRAGMAARACSRPRRRGIGLVDADGEGGSAL